VTVLKSYFNIDKWQINQLLLYPDIYDLLDQVDGVQVRVQKLTLLTDSQHLLKI
jgi:hypothetical protein